VQKITDNRPAGLLHKCVKCGEVINQPTDDQTGHLQIINFICGNCGIIMSHQIIWADCTITKTPTKTDGMDEFFKGIQGLI